MTKKSRIKVNREDILVTNETLEFIAAQPAGGSGEGSYITGRIQSMAKELLFYRKKFYNGNTHD